MNTQPKILILRLSAIGDTIHTLVLANAIKKAFPQSKIGWVVEDKAELFVKNHPSIDKCYVIPKKIWKKRGFSYENFKEFKKIIQEINAENYDMVLDTQQLFKSAVFLAFLNIKRKITLSCGREFSWIFANEIIKSKHDLFHSDYHVVHRNLEFAKYLGINSDEIEFNLKDATDEIKVKISEKLKNIDPKKPVVVVSPATTWQNKHWQESYWSEVLDFLKDKANIIFTGTSADLELIGRITANSDITEALILAGETNLEELAEVFRHADIVISPDSGSTHIAWAVSKPYVITIFTSTSAKRNAPFGEKCFALSPKILCHPCMKKKCSAKIKNICTEKVLPEQVIEILEKIL